MTGISLAGCDPVITRAESDARPQRPAIDARALDAAPSAPSAPDASGGMVCTPACLSDTLLRECTGGEHMVTCLLGCISAEARCRTFVPSNGATRGHLDGVTHALTVPEGATMSIDTNTGKITIDGDVVRRMGFGLNDGIKFEYVSQNLSVFAVQAMTMGARSNLRARGDRPLLILSAGDVEIAGTIDVSAGCDSGPFPSSKSCGGPGGGRGADEQNLATGCSPGGNGAIDDSSRDYGGGGGGGSGQSGAAGASNEDAAGGGGGQACDTSMDLLRGGSGGGRCGYTSGDNDGEGSGGGGGGALQITSYTAIRVVSSGVLDAGGSGGVSGPRGGGGGGAGGGILLEAPKLTLEDAVIVANGGGGGGEGYSASGEDGRLDDEQARGEDGGGYGGAFQGSPTAGSLDGSAPGGGGGAAGWIVFRVPSASYSLTNSVVSPGPVRRDPQAE